MNYSNRIQKQTFVSRPESPQPAKLRISGLGEGDYRYGTSESNVNMRDFYTTFNKLGRVSNVHEQCHPDDQPTGIMYVPYSNQEHAENAFTELKRSDQATTKGGLSWTSIALSANGRTYRSLVDVSSDEKGSTSNSHTNPVENKRHANGEVTKKNKSEVQAGCWVSMGPEEDIEPMDEMTSGTVSDVRFVSAEAEVRDLVPPADDRAY
jgi:hypothetical protein